MHYVFDLSDRWTHLCTVTGEDDSLDEFDEIPDRPMPYWGWGRLPGQHEHRWDGDDRESPMPKRPVGGLGDLPFVLPL